MVISTWSLQRRWQRLQRPLALILLTGGALLLWGDSAAVTPTAPTLVAARGVPAGQVLTSADVTVVDWPADLRPPATAASPDQVVNRRTTSALTAGEPVTAQRVVGPSALSAAGDGLVAVLLPEDPLAASGTVHAGDRVDVIGRTREAARTLVSGALVLSVTQEAGLIVAVPATSAVPVVEAAGSHSVAAVLQGG